MATEDVTTSEPWGPTGGYLQQQYDYRGNLMGRANAAGNTPFQFFPGSTVPDRSAGSIGGQRAGEALMDPNSLSSSAGNYLGDVMGGKYLDQDSNPYMRAVGDAAAGDTTRDYLRTVAPATSMSSMGRGGSGSEFNREGQAQENLAQRLYEGRAGLYGGQYARERGAMGSAAGMAPGVSSARRGDIGAAISSGQVGEQYDRSLLDEQRERFDFNQNEPWKRIGLMSGLNSGAPTTYSTGKETVKRGFGASDIFGMISGGLGALGGIMSSRKFKDHIDEVDAELMLQALEKLEIALWQYKGEYVKDDQMPHVGPYAEDVQKLFGIGDGRRINGIDLIGVAMAATKGMAERLIAMEARVRQLEGQPDDEQLAFMAEAAPEPETTPEPEAANEEMDLLEGVG